MIFRGQMSAAERQLRSALNRLLSQQGIVHGTLLTRQRVCGKATCRCARGHRHESLYLVVTEAGQSRQMYVPRRWEAAVRQWIANYSQARHLMDELSRLHWDKIRDRQD
jgi:Family of unknown function (DUF6788)